MFTSPVKVDTKTIRLCRQVEETISFALAGSTSPVLRDLNVVGVEPLKGASALRVLVSTEEDTSPSVITEALNRAKNYLRGEVARAINRRRVPTLDFEIVPSRARPADLDPTP